MRKKIIGLTADVDAERTSSILYPYVRAIERSGALPILLPYVEGEATVAELAALCDGFLFTGGVDVAPHYYGEETKSTCGEIHPQRDELEMKMLDAAMKTGKPILAICRGAQLVNIYLGGTLHQDIPSEIPSEIFHKQKEPKFSPSHEVKILEGTPLARLVGRGRMQANSFHHQAIKALGAGLAVMARADDGVVEAVTLVGERYLRAYQWHPERLFDSDEDNRRIFFDFLAACGNEGGF